MNREQILNEIEKTKQHLANMEKMLKECDDRRKPKDKEQYWYITDYGTVNYTLFMSRIQNDNMRFENYNCFPTREEAKQELEKILVRRQLEDIARRLNKGQKIDWKNNEQHKYMICMDSVETIYTKTYYGNIFQGAVYCLNTNFPKVAIQEIGLERLKKYLRG